MTLLARTILTAGNLWLYKIKLTSENKWGLGFGLYPTISFSKQLMLLVLFLLLIGLWKRVNLLHQPELSKAPNNLLAAFKACAGHFLLPNREFGSLMTKVMQLCSGYFHFSPSYHRIFNHCWKHWICTRSGETVKKKWINFSQQVMIIHILLYLCMLPLSLLLVDQLEEF